MYFFFFWREGGGGGEKGEVIACVKMGEPKSGKVSSSTSQSQQTYPLSNGKGTCLKLEELQVKEGASDS